MTGQFPVPESGPIFKTLDHSDGYTTSKAALKWLMSYLWPEGDLKVRRRERVRNRLSHEYRQMSRQPPSSVGMLGRASAVLIPKTFLRPPPPPPSPCLQDAGIARLVHHFPGRREGGCFALLCFALLSSCSRTLPSSMTQWVLTLAPSQILAVQVPFILQRAVDKINANAVAAATSQGATAAAAAGAGASASAAGE